MPPPSSSKNQYVLPTAVALDREKVQVELEKKRRQLDVKRDLSLSNMPATKRKSLSEEKSRLKRSIKILEGILENPAGSVTVRRESLPASMRELVPAQPTEVDLNGADAVRDDHVESTAGGSEDVPLWQRPEFYGKEARFTLQGEVIAITYSELNSERRLSGTSAGGDTEEQIRGSAARCGKLSGESLMSSAKGKDIGDELKGAWDGAHTKGLETAAVNILRFVGPTVNALSRPVAKVVAVLSALLPKESSDGGLRKQLESDEGVIFEERKIEGRENVGDEGVALRVHQDRVYVLEKDRDTGELKPRNGKEEPFLQFIFNATVHATDGTAMNYRAMTDKGADNYSFDTIFASVFIAHFLQAVFGNCIPDFIDLNIFVRVVRMLMTIRGTAPQLGHRDSTLTMMLTQHKTRMKVTYNRNISFGMMHVVPSGPGWVQLCKTFFRLFYVPLQSDAYITALVHEIVGVFHPDLLHRSMKLNDIIDECDEAASNGTRPPLPDLLGIYLEQMQEFRVESGQIVFGNAATPHYGDGFPVQEKVEVETRCLCTPGCTKGAQCESLKDLTGDDAPLDEWYFSRYGETKSRLHFMLESVLGGVLDEEVSKLKAEASTFPLDPRAFVCEWVEEVQRKNRKNMTVRVLKKSRCLDRYPRDDVWARTEEGAALIAAATKAAKEREKKAQAEAKAAKASKKRKRGGKAARGG